MKITPLDIQQKKFPVTFRGFNKEEVVSFLGDIRDGVEEISRENLSLREELSKTNRELEDYKNVESSLRNMLVATQQMVEEYKGNIQKEAEIIKKEAELKANNMLETAHQKVIKMHEDISELKRLRGHFLGEVRRLIENHFRMLVFYEDTAAGNNAYSVINDGSGKNRFIPSSETGMPDLLSVFYKLNGKAQQ